MEIKGICPECKRTNHEPTARIRLISSHNKLIQGEGGVSICMKNGEMTATCHWHNCKIELDQ